jgi:hypothetical protein
METVVAIFTWIFTNYQTVISLVVGILTAIIALCLIIPGNEPETFLQKVVDFLAKFSKK